MSLKEYKRFINSIIPCPIVNVEDKEKNIQAGIMYTFLRLQSMFHYDGLPDSIPQKFLEYYLMLNGHCAIFNFEGKLYACSGGFGGEPDAYYVPRQYIVANPYLKLYETFARADGQGPDSVALERDENCVVMGNDSAYFGLYPLVSKYIALMAENELSMNLSVINSRIMSIITVNTDNEYHSAQEYLKDVKDGKVGSLLQAPFFDGIKVQPYAHAQQANALTNLIEYEQYLKASLFNELGLNANYNMKRESINSNESQLNDDMLTPLIDDMLAMRREGIEKVNDLFGTDIKVDFASAWKENDLTNMTEFLNLVDQGGGKSDISDTSSSSNSDLSDNNDGDVPADNNDELREESVETEASETAPDAAGEAENLEEDRDSDIEQAKEMIAEEVVDYVEAKED